MDPSTIVIGDLVDGPDPPPMSVGTRLEDDVAVKNEPAPAFGAPIVEVSACQAPSVEPAGRMRQQPKRQRIEPLAAGRRVWHGGMQDGRHIKFKGTVIEVCARTNQCRVRFDDGDEKAVSPSSLHVLAEEGVPPPPPPREEEEGGLEELSEEEEEEEDEEEADGGGRRRVGGQGWQVDMGVDRG